jgi:hypothetical protein
MARLTEYQTRIEYTGDIGESIRVYVIKNLCFVSLFNWSYDVDILSYDQKYINY